MRYVLLYAGADPGEHVELVCGERQAAAGAEQYEQAASLHNPVSASRAGSPVNSGCRAVIWSHLQIMPGRRAFLRRRHVAAAASRAHRRPRVRAQTSSLPVASSCVLERRCCRAASGARAADGPARRVGLPPATWGPVIAAHRYRRSQRRPQPPSRQFSRHFPWLGSEYLLTRDVPEAGRFCGVDRLQITCPRRSKYPSAFTAKTPKFGLEITAEVCAPVQSWPDHSA